MFRETCSGLIPPCLLISFVFIVPHVLYTEGVLTVGGIFLDTLYLQLSCTIYPGLFHSMEWNINKFDYQKNKASKSVRCRRIAPPAQWGSEAYIQQGLIRSEPKTVPFAGMGQPQSCWAAPSWLKPGGKSIFRSLGHAIPWFPLYFSHPSLFRQALVKLYFKLKSESVLHYECLFAC
jgi:hypothetical protein